MVRPSWLPIKQYEGFRLLESLTNMGVAELWMNTPETNQAQGQFVMKSDNSLFVEDLVFLKEKFQCDYLQVRLFFDDDANKEKTVIELTYGVIDE